MNKTEAIEITVESHYLPEQSSPKDDRYVFSYHITVLNQSSHSVQLLNRHWIITDANGEIEEVKGEGVVGEQPVIPPSQNYQYTSGTILKTPIGTMQGNYQMRDEKGEHFNAAIPIFRLAMPGIVH